MMAANRAGRDPLPSEEALEGLPEHYPPLLKRVSWTLCAPFKEERYHRAVSDSIANNYSPRAAHLSVGTVAKAPIRSAPKGMTLNRNVRCANMKPTS
jgi:hypothetical protein